MFAVLLSALCRCCGLARVSLRSLSLQSLSRRMLAPVGSAPRLARFAQRGVVALVLLGTVLFAAPAFAQAVFSSQFLGSGNFDATVGLNVNNTYIDAVNIAGSPITINGVSFAGSSGGNPSGSGYSTSNWGNGPLSGGTVNVTGNLGTALNDFNYGDGVNPQVFTLSGLNPGQAYEMTFYDRDWSAGDVRGQAITTTSGGSTTFSEDQGNTGDGNLLRYTFVATAANESITMTPLNGASFHFYAFSNTQVFNNTLTTPFTSGSNWSSSTWTNSSANPSTLTWSTNWNIAGSNAILPQEGSPTTITVDTGITVGHLQLIDANGNAGWTIAGSNTLTLQGDPGGVSMVNVASGTHNISAPVSLANNVNVYGGGSLNISGNISGTGALSYQGANGSLYSGGSLALTGANSYNGGTTVSGGTLRVNADAALGAVPTAPATSLTFAGNSTLQAGAGAVNLGATRNIQVNSGATATIDTQTNSMTIGGAISGGGSLRKIGNGALTLTNTNTYTGSTTIFGGSVVLAPVQQLLTDNFSATGNPNTGNLNFNLVNRQTGGSALQSWTGGGNVQVGNPTNVGQPAGVNGNYLLLAFNGAAATLAGLPLTTANVPGPLSIQFNMFPGDATNGDTTLWTSFTLSSTAGTGFPVVGSGQFGFLYRNNTGVQVFNNGGAIATINSTNGTGAFALYLTDSTGTGSPYDGNGTIVTVAEGGSVLGTYTLNTGMGTTYLTFGSNSAMIGGVDGLVVGAGASQATNVLPPATPLTINSGGMLDLHGTAQTVASLSDYSPGVGGIVTNSVNTPATLTLAPTSGSTTFSGVITDGGLPAGALTLTKTGAGTQVLAGANTYNGATNILGGSLRLAASGSIRATLAVTVGGAGASGTPTLTGTGTVGGVTINGASGGAAGHLAPGINTSGNSGAIGTLSVSSLTLNSGGVLDYDFGTPGVIGAPGQSDLTAIAGALSLPNSGSVTLNLFDNAGANMQGSIGNGTYKLFGFNSVNNFSNTIFSIGTSPLSGRSYSFSNTGTELDITIATEAWTGGANTGAWQISGNWQAGAIPGNTTGTPGNYTNTDTATFNGPGNGQLAITPDSNRNLQSIVFDTASAGAYVVGTTGGNPLLLTNNGGIQTTPTVTNTETVNAPLVIEGAASTITSNSTSGTLRIGGGITGNISGGGVTTLTINGANGNQNTISGTIADTGSTQIALVKDGAGTWVLNNVNTYSGGTTISNGILQLGDGTTNGSVAGNILNNATLVFNNASQQTYSGVISGPGAVNVNGTAPLIFTGASTGGGATTINGLSLQLGDGTNNGSVGGNIINNTSLIITTNSSGQTLNNVISGGGTFRKTGPGVLTIAAAQAYTGPTTISAGTVRVQQTALTVPNSGFTTPVGAGQFAYNIPGGSWTFLSNSGIAANNSAFGVANSPSGFAGLLQNVDGANGTFSQTINFPTAGSYAFSFAMEARAGDPALNPISALFNGTAIAGLTSITPLSTSSFNTVTAVFNVATPGNYSIGFASLGSDNTINQTTFVTDVAVTDLGGLPPNTALTIAGGAMGGTLDLNCAVQQVGSIAGPSGAIVTNSSTTATGTLDIAPTTGTVTYNGTIQDGPSEQVAVQIGGAAGTVVALAGTNNYTGGTILSGGTLSLTTAGGIGTGSISFSGGTLQFTSVNTTDYSAQFSSAANQAYSIDTNNQSVAFGSSLSSSGGTLTKLGLGTLTLTTANSYTGATTISAGTLQIGDGTSSSHDGSLATSGVAIANNAALVYNIVGSQAGAYPITGNGSVTKLGGGTQSLGAPFNPSTYGGGTAVNAGTLVASYNTSLGTGTVTVASGATLRVIANPLPSASVTNFGGTGTNWTLNNNGTGGPTIVSDVLTLTDNNNGEGRNAFFNTPQPVLSGANGFTASFVYTATGGNPFLADGMSFIVQNDSRGANATGGGDGGLGYAGITPSAALEINVYPGRTQGTIIATGGATQVYNSFPNVASGDPIQVTLTYNPTANSLTETLIDPSAGNATYTNTLNNVNLGALLGGNSAYIGFGGGTGGFASTQQISNFSYTLAAGTPNTYANSVTLPASSNATIDVGASAGASPIAVAMGGLTVNAGGAATLNVTASTAPTGQSYSLSLGAVTLGSGLSLNVSNNGTGSGTLSLGALNDGGTPQTVNLSGAGTVVLTSPAMTVTAGAMFNVNAGTLRVANTSGSATGSGNVTLNAGTLASGPVGAISGNVMAGSGAHVIAPGGIGSIGTLSVGGVTTSANTTFNFDLGAPVASNTYSGDLVNLTGGGLTIGGQSAVTFGANPTAQGDYRLFGGNIGTWTPTTLASSFSLPVAPAGLAYTLSTAVDPSYIDLVVAPGVFTAYWNSTGLGTASWNNSANWTNLNSIPNSSGSTAIFDNSLGASATSTATLDGNETIGHLAFNNSSVSYTIAQGTGAGTLTIDNSATGATGGPTIEVDAGSHTISAPVGLANGVTVTTSADPSPSSPALTISGGISGSGGLVKAGPGTLQLSSADSYGGGTTVSAGTLRTTIDSALGSGSLTANATVSLGGNENIGSLSGSSAGSVSVVAGATLAVNQTSDNSLAGSLTLGTSGSGAILTKTGANSLTLSGVTTINQSSAINVSGGALQLNVASGSTIGSMVTVTVGGSATLQLAGTNSALADPSLAPAKRAAVVNVSTAAAGIDVLAGAMQQVGGIDGDGVNTPGNVVLENNSSLTADHINQTSLVIGAGATFTLAPSDPSGNPMAAGGGLVLAGSLTPASSFLAASGTLLGGTSSAAAPAAVSLGGVGGTTVSAVPEPSTVLLFAGALAALGVAGRRRRLCAGVEMEK